MTDVDAMMHERDIARAVVDDQIADIRESHKFPAFVSIAQSACGSNGDSNVFDLRCEHCETIVLEKSGSSIEEFVLEHASCKERLTLVVTELNNALHLRFIPYSRLLTWATRIRAARDDRETTVAS